MRTTSAEIGETNALFPSAGRMLAIGIPFWLCIVGGSALSHTLKGWQWNISHLPTDLLIIFGGAAIGSGIYVFLRRNTRLGFNQQIAAALLLIGVIAVPTEMMLRGARLVAPLARPNPAPTTVLISPGPNGSTLRQIIKPPPEPKTAAEMFRPNDVLRGGIFWLAILSLWAAVCLAMLRDREARHRERRMSALQAEAHDAQVRALRYQVNPHFLYNTLSSISTLILENKSELAERMTMQLSAFFRYSLATDPFQDVRLADELELQRLYLEIEQTRFADSLRVEYDVPPSLSDALVPSLILQPLIENSIKHGLQEAGKMTVLTISARRISERLVLEIADDGRGPGTEHGTGVGLGNVRRRLTTRFGSNCRFIAGAMERGGFAVRLEMPLQLAA